MISYTCDGCGKTIAKDALRYTVKIDVRAAYDQLRVGLADLVRDHRQELVDLIRRMEERSGKAATDIEETVYKCIELDLCPVCQRAFIPDPLRFHPEHGALEEAVDIDSFLRSLGYGKGPQSEEES